MKTSQICAPERNPTSLQDYPFVCHVSGVSGNLQETTPFLFLFAQLCSGLYIGGRARCHRCCVSSYGLNSMRVISFPRITRISTLNLLPGQTRAELNWVLCYFSCTENLFNCAQSGPIQTEWVMVHQLGRKILTRKNRACICGTASQVFGTLKCWTVDIRIKQTRAHCTMFWL